MRAARGLIIGVLIGSMLWVALGLLVMQARAGENADVRWRKAGWAVVHDAISFTVKFKNRTDQGERITCKVKLFDDDGKVISKGWTKPRWTPTKEWRKRSTVIYKRNIHNTFDHWRIKRCLLVDTV